MKEEEDFITDMTHRLNHDLPTKIQSLIKSTANDCATEASFYLPDDATLETDDIKRGIERHY